MTDLGMDNVIRLLRGATADLKADNDAADARELARSRENLIDCIQQVDSFKDRLRKHGLPLETLLEVELYGRALVRLDRAKRSYEALNP